MLILARARTKEKHVWSWSHPRSDITKWHKIRTVAYANYLLLLLLINILLLFFSFKLSYDLIRVPVLSVFPMLCTVLHILRSTHLCASFFDIHGHCLIFIFFFINSYFTCDLPIPRKVLFLHPMLCLIEYAPDTRIYI